MDIEEVFQSIKEIENGKSIEEVSTEKQIGPEVLRSNILLYGGSKGRDILKKELLKQFPVSIEDIIVELNEGKSIKDISSEIGIKYEELFHLLRKYQSITGQIIQKKHISLNKRYDIDEHTIIEKYRRGERIFQIAKELDASSGTIRRILDKHIERTGEDIDKEHKKSKEIKKEMKKDNTPSDTTNKKIIRENRKRELMKQMIRNGYSYEEVSKRLKEYGTISKLEFYQAVVNEENRKKFDEER